MKKKPTTSTLTPTAPHEPFQMVRRSQLFPSALNPRKTFSVDALRELAVSMRSGTGVIQPLTVRPGDGSSELFEIVCGERRWRASGALQVDGRALPAMEFLPVKIVTMTDEEALRAMLAENMQREDLSAIEEARAFASALEGGGTQMALAESLGIAPVRIHSRLKLLRLSAQGIELVEAGSISLVVAEEIASAPASMIPKLCNFLSSPKKFPLERFPRAYDDPFTVEDVENVVRSMSARLHEAPFDLYDALLVPVHLATDGTRLDGGACEGCPFNTQTNAEKKAGKGIRADVPFCTNRNCYDEKVERFTASALVAAKDAGAVVASADEAARIFAEGATRVNPDYVELDAELLHEEKAAGVKRVTWRELVSDKSGRPTTPVIAAADAKGNVRKFSRRELAELAAVKMGNGKLLAGQAADPSLDKRERVEQEAARDEQARTARKERRDRVFELSEKFTEQFLNHVHYHEDWAIGLAIRHATPSGVEFICKRRGLDVEDGDERDAILLHTEDLGPTERAALFFELLLALDFADAIRDEKKPLIAEAIRPALEYFGAVKKGKN